MLKYSYCSVFIFSLYQYSTFMMDGICDSLTQSLPAAIGRAPIFGNSHLNVAIGSSWNRPLCWWTVDYDHAGVST